MKKTFIILLLALCFTTIGKAQKEITVFGTVYQGDTIPFAYLEPITVVGYICPLSANELRQYSKLIRDVKVSYPYAIKLQQLLNGYISLLNNAQNDSQRDKIKKQAAQDVNNKFSSQIKHLTKNQGKVLVKLIYRQTGRSAYNLMKDFGGGFKTMFYNTTSKFYGIHLDDTYSPQNDLEDRVIERIVVEINTNKL
jgi:hypothetical protein